MIPGSIKRNLLTHSIEDTIMPWQSVFLVNFRIFKVMLVS